MYSVGNEAKKTSE